MFYVLPCWLYTPTWILVEGPGPTNFHWMVAKVCLLLKTLSFDRQDEPRLHGWELFRQSLKKLWGMDQLFFELKKKGVKSLKFKRTVAICGYYSYCIHPSHNWAPDLEDEQQFYEDTRWVLNVAAFGLSWKENLGVQLESSRVQHIWSTIWSQEACAKQGWWSRPVPRKRCVFLRFGLWKKWLKGDTIFDGILESLELITASKIDTVLQCFWVYECDLLLKT